MQAEIMQEIKIRLDFGSFSLDAELFDSGVSARFVKHLPCVIALQQWGDELYGPIGKDLGEESPVAEIPTGGIAYSRTGHLLCIFFGQKPAWPVEYIGRICGEQWKKLVSEPKQASVSIHVQRRNA